MTGFDLYNAARSELALTGQDPAKLAPDVFVELLNSTMREIQRQAAIYVGRFVLTTTAGYWGNRLRTSATGPYLTILRILSATYGGRQLRIERPLDFAIPETSDTVATGAPENIWIDDTQYRGAFSAAAEQSIGVWPVPDAAYPIRLRLAMPIPDYSNWYQPLPCRTGTHEVVGDAVMAKLYSTRSFHDNAMKGAWLAKAQAGIDALKEYERRQLPIPAEVYGATRWVEVSS